MNCIVCGDKATHSSLCLFCFKDKAQMEEIEPEESSYCRFIHHLIGQC